jgi:hypothetical protein
VKGKKEAKKKEKKRKRHSCIMRAFSKGLWLGISQPLHPLILPRVSTLRTTTDEFVSQTPHAIEKKIPIYNRRGSNRRTPGCAIRKEEGSKGKQRKKRI